MIKIQDVLRAGYVKRWNIINTTRQQSLAEHLFNVAMIAGVIEEKLGGYHIRKIVIEWALVHDIPEVVCGDTPTPTKRRMERSHSFSMEVLHETIDPTYKKLKEQAKTIQGGMPYDLVKIADLMEAIHFLHDHGIGKHAKQVKKGIQISLDVLIEKFSDKYSSKLRSENEIIRIIRNIYLDIMEGEIYE